MANKDIRIVIDTNVWISFLISQRYIHLDKLLQLESVELVFSEELLFEFIEVAERPKLNQYFSEEDKIDLLNSMNQVGNIVEVTSKIDHCRDPKDNFLLALCYDSKADYLITGDDDLLTIEKYGKTKICTYIELIDKLNMQ